MTFELAGALPNGTSGAIGLGHRTLGTTWSPEQYGGKMCQSGRLKAVGLTVALLVGAACAGHPVASDSQSARSPEATRFSPGSFDLWVPGEIGPDASPNCGFPPDWKFAVRFGLPVQVSAGMWRFDGCISSPGNVFHDVTVVLAFPDGAQVALPAISQTKADGESHFSVSVLRANAEGARATVYCNYTSKT